MSERPWQTPESAAVTRWVAAPDESADHFESRLRYETDCWDTNEALRSGAREIAVLDVRSEAAFAAGHVPGSHSLPRREISTETLDAISTDAMFVVYCAGPHCNGADKAAWRSRGSAAR